MEIIDKIVNFMKYCKTCEHEKLKSTDDPCNDCLDHPVNAYTTRPLHYKKNENKKNEEE